MFVTLVRACALLGLLAACTSGRTVRSENRPDQGATAVPDTSAAAGAAPSGSSGAAPSDDPKDEANADAPLPAAFKGYELYAWDQDGALEFTLITGTNREKTLAELTARTPEVLDGEWVVIAGQGLPALTATLDRVPPGTSVVMARHEGLPSLSAQNRSAVTALLSSP